MARRVSPFLESVWEDREIFRIEGREISVVSRGGLGKMKRTAGRPQDLNDIQQPGLDENDP